MKFLKYISIILLTITVGCNTEEKLPNEALSPRVTFTADPKEITEGDAIVFSDNSTNTPTSWQWTFNGGTPATSTEKNPKVVYEAEGTYSVTLSVTNEFGSDEITYENYITVNSSEIPAQVALDFENNLTNTGTVAVNASTTGTPSYGTRPNNGGSYIFSGSNSLITDGYKGVNGKDARTMTAWIKPAATGYDSGIMSWGVSAYGSRWSFKYRPGNGGLRIEWQGGGMNSVKGGLNDGNWHHVAVTFDGTDTVTLYIDGEKDSSKKTTIINTGKAGKTNVEIGSYRGTFYYKGEMDNVRIYNLAFSAEEIKALFEK